MFDRVTPILRSQLVAEQVIDKIRQSNLRPGDRLAPEREMAESMKVSRNTLREAIAMLQLAGILEVRRGSGIFVAEGPDEQVVRQWLSEAKFSKYIDSETAIDARIAVEPGVAVLASRTATSDDWARFDSHVGAMREALEAGDVPVYRRSDHALHRSIAMATHNRVVGETLLPLLDTAQQPLWNRIKENVYTTDILRESFAEHCEIVAAMRSPDECRIFQAMSTHLKKSKDRLALDI